MKDKYTAIWVSHSSISDYLKCPRLYFLRNVYRDPKTHRKISLIQPALALGQVIHETLEDISRLPHDKRFQRSLLDLFLLKWKTVSGQLGGFRSNEEEQTYKEKGQQMIERIIKNPGPLRNKAIKIRHDLPYYWLSEEDNIILCGKIDWLEYIPEYDSVHIIDFKTGKYDEDEDSLQLPIYYLIAKHTQSKPIMKASYWYLERDDGLIEVLLPEEHESVKRIMDIAKKISLARKLEHFVCKSKQGCRFCLPYEDILAGKATLVGTNPYGQDVYRVG
ncbi:MAG: PD-(D/E)XK nuclease family protein [Patescibacteria group bacterium]|nr:PD-(D/E)XK nuclease family protein [Patescibacteria group bacterium]